MQGNSCGGVDDKGSAAPHASRATAWYSSRRYSESTRLPQATVVLARVRAAGALIEGVLARGGYGVCGGIGSEGGPEGSLPTPSSSGRERPINRRMPNSIATQGSG